MQVCTSLQTDNHANTSLLSFLQAGCPSCRPTNSVKALKAKTSRWIELFLSWELPVTHPKWCYKEIRVSPKIRVLPSGALPETLDLENFTAAS